MAGSDYGGGDDSLTFQAGVASGEDNGDPTYVHECADTKRWLRRIDEARKFDEEARKQYAKNRKQARGDQGKFEVTVPICQSYIDVMNSFLYAKNPQVSCSPSGMTEPPPQKDIEAMVLEQQQQGQGGMAPPAGMMDNAMPGAMSGLLGGAPAGAPPPPGSAPPPGGMGGGLASILAKFAPGLAAKIGGSPIPGQPPGGMPGAPPPDPEKQLQEQVAKLLAPYQKKRSNAKQLSATLELVITALWKRSKLKLRAKMLVKSALTVGPGVLKAFWMERQGKDPVVQGQIDDLLEMMADMKRTRDQIAEDDCGDMDAQLAELAQQETGLKAKVEVMVARGFVIDFIPAEDFQVSPDVSTLAQYQDAEWLGHRTFKTLEQAQADYPNVADKLKKLANYHPVKPRGTDGLNAPSFIDSQDISPKDADSYRKGGETTDQSTAGEGATCCVCIWEIWDRTTTNVLTFIEGLECYAKDPYVPEVASTRGHPFFMYTIGNIDGLRHPRSMTSRSQKLFDEYDRMRSASAKHRRRALPKLGFDATNYDADEIAKLEAGDIGEMVGLKPIDPQKPLKDCLFPIAYNNYDGELYDTSTVRAELEMIWGVQEADTAAIQTAKTATEAGIEDQGKQSRNGFMTSDLDDMLEDLAQYTGEVAIQKMDTKDVEAIAGPWALWPTGMGIEELSELVEVSIQAGSSGKPATMLERQAWSTLLPVMQNAIMEIGKLRGSDPSEIADCLEALVQETANRAGDHIDAQQFLPDPPRVPPPPPQPPPVPLMDSALMGPQTLAMLSIVADVKARVLSVQSAKGLMLASFPHVPPEVVDQMVDGVVISPLDPPTQIKTAHAETVPPPAPEPKPGTSATTGATTA